MKKNTTGAGCPRKAMTHALRYELGLQAERTGTCSITFGAISFPSEAVFNAAADAAIDNRHDMIVSVWADNICEKPSGYALILRSIGGAEVLEVEPAQLDKSRPLVMVSLDRKRMFFLNERAIVVEAKCDRGGKVERAIRRGKSILDKAAADGSERTVRWEHTRVTVEGDIVKTQNN